MKPTLISKLCCPFDKSTLSLTIYKQQADQDIREGLLQCSHCQRYYPIIYGVPIMTPDDYREKALEQPVLEKWGLTSTKTTFQLEQ